LRAVVGEAPRATGGGANRRARKHSAESRADARGGAVEPELGPGAKAPVPGDGVTGAPGVLLAARDGVELVGDAVDLDGAADRERRVRADVGHRRQALPARAKKRERRLARLPAQLPPRATPLGMHLAGTALSVEDCPFEADPERPGLGAQ